MKAALRDWIISWSSLKPARQIDTKARRVTKDRCILVAFLLISVLESGVGLVIALASQPLHLVWLPAKRMSQKEDNFFPSRCGSEGRQGSFLHLLEFLPSSSISLSLNYSCAHAYYRSKLGPLDSVIVRPRALHPERQTDRQRQIK